MLRNKLAAAVFAVCISAGAAPAIESIYSNKVLSWHIDCYEDQGDFSGCQAWTAWDVLGVGMSIGLVKNTNQMSISIISQTMTIEKNRNYKVGFKFPHEGEWMDMTGVGIDVQGMKGILISGNTPYKMVDALMEDEAVTVFIDDKEAMRLSLRGARVALRELFGVMLAYVPD